MSLKSIRTQRIKKNYTDVLSNVSGCSIIQVFFCMISHVESNGKKMDRFELRIGSCLACVYRDMDARGKFGEHKRCLRVAPRATLAS